MYYKLFILGENKIFAIVEIIGGEFLKKGDIFLFKNIRYEIFFHIRIARELEFDEKGKRTYKSFSDDAIGITTAELPEIYMLSSLNQ